VIAPWLSFLIIIAIILVFSRYELSIVLFISSILFGLLCEIDIIDSLHTVLLDPSMILLAFAIALIPILGGLIDDSGMMTGILDNMDLSNKKSLMLTPGLFGLFPVAGGALMSAPIVNKIAPKLNPDKKVAINVWFRHIVILIYPLSPALLLLSELSKINIYIIIFSMLIPFFVLFIIGYYTFIHSIDEPNEKHERNMKKVLFFIIPLIIAPIIDIIGRNCFKNIFPNLFLVIGLLISIFVTLKIGNVPIVKIKKISKKMKLWRFPLLIFSIFLFLEIFNNSGIKEDISNLNLPFLIFLLLSVLLGFATGEFQVPLSILIPVYLVQNNISIMPLIDCIYIYSAVFIGYLITPIHPCVAYSNDYFKAKFQSSLKLLIIPTLISLTFLFGSYFILTSI